MSKPTKQNSAVVLDGGGGEAVMQKPVMEAADLRTGQLALK